MEEEVSMPAQMSRMFRRETDESFASVSPSRSDRIRTITYWTFTVLLVWELVAGSLWNFERIEWIRLQLNHLGYPVYLAYILGVWLMGGAAAIIVPGFPRLKEWAYAGCCFHFSGAMASHMMAGDWSPISMWLTPLMFWIFGMVSWALSPADRRLPNAELGPEARPRAWAVSIGVFLLLFVVSYLMLPWVNTAMHKRALDLG